MGRGNGHDNGSNNNREGDENGRWSKDNNADGEDRHDAAPTLRDDNDGKGKIGTTTMTTAPPSCRCE
jgi:hypothetical protein